MEFAKAFLLPEQSTLMPVFVIRLFIGVDLNACRNPSVLALKVTWLMKLAKVIKRKIARIACASLAVFPTANKKFVHLAATDCVANHLKLAPASASSVQKMKFFA